MKAIIFLCFALIASYHTVAAISRAEILSLLQQDYTVDKVLQLFQALKAQENSDLAQLDKDYAQASPALAGEVERTTTNLNNQVAQCNDNDDKVNQGKNQQAKLEENVKNAQDTIASNDAKAKAAADARCASNLLFISELGNRQEAVDFLNYLRGRVADPAFADYIRQQGGAFIQLKAALASKQEGEILSLIAKHHMLSLLQKGEQNYEGEADLSATLNAKVRTSDEIGTDYQDNSRGALAVQGLGDDSVSAEQYVQQLIGYIDELIKNLQGDIAKLQAVETQAVQAFIEYKRQLKDQNYVLQQYIDATTKALAELAVVQANNQKAAEECRATIPGKQQEVQNAKDAKAAYEAAYATRRGNLVDTLALLDQVIQLYTEEVVNVAPESYKNRADDYLDNQVFDRTADFTARKPLAQ